MVCCDWCLLLVVALLGGFAGCGDWYVLFVCWVAAFWGMVVDCLALVSLFEVWLC